MLRYLLLSVVIVSCGLDESPIDHDVPEPVLSSDSIEAESSHLEQLVSQDGSELGSERGSELNSDGLVSMEDDPNQSDDPSQSQLMNGVKIDGIRFEGVGCNENNTFADLSEDGLSFDLVYADLFAEKLFGSEAASQECFVELDISYPVGWSFTILNTVYRGAVTIDEGVSGLLEVAYGRNNEVIETGSFVFEGPQDDLFVAPIDWRDEFNDSCDGRDTLQIRTFVSIEGDIDSEGLITVDSLTGLLESETQLLWSKCSEER